MYKTIVIFYLIHFCSFSISGEIVTGLPQDTCKEIVLLAPDIRSTVYFLNTCKGARELFYDSKNGKGQSFLDCIFAKLIIPRLQKNISYLGILTEPLDQKIKQYVQQDEYPQVHSMIDNIWVCIKKHSNKDNALDNLLDIKTMAILLTHSSVDVNKKKDCYNFPIISAIICNNTEMLKLLLKHPNIDVNNNDPLSIAIHNQNIKALKLLLKHPNIDVHKNDSLGYAIRHQKIKALKLLLKHPKIDVHKNDPLGCAIYSQNIEALNLLLEPMKRKNKLPFLLKCYLKIFTCLGLEHRAIEFLYSHDFLYFLLTRIEGQMWFLISSCSLICLMVGINSL